MKKKNIIRVVLSCVVIVAFVLIITLPIINVRASEPATQQVGELWNDETKKFDSNNLLTLFKQISGDETFTYADYPTIHDMAEANTTATTFRTNGVSSKQKGDEIVVTLGGLDWVATYLSVDKNDNPILTLLLKSPLQSDDKTLKSYWMPFFVTSDVTQKYPASMYSTSYIRAVTLNNGGVYLSNKEDLEAEQLTSAVPASEHPLAAFTYDRKDADGETDIVDLRDFLVQPKDVAWQEDGQSGKNLGYISFKSSNDNWKKNQDNTDFSNENAGDRYFNFSDREHYDDWSNDYVWLPSISEIGFFMADRGGEHQGIWELSEQERRFDSEIYSTSADVYWLRTALWNSSSSSLLMKNDGTGYSYSNGSNIYGVRPALHLNLNKAALTTTSGEKTDFDISYNFQAGSAFNSEGLVIYNVYSNGLKIAVNEEFTCDVVNGTVLKEGDEIHLMIGQTIYTYIVPKTTLEKDKFEATSLKGFGGSMPVSLDVKNISSAEEIDTYLTENGLILNNVRNIYTVKLLRGTDTKLPLNDLTAVIKARASKFGANCNFYTVENGTLTKLAVDQSGYISHDGTELTLIVQSVSSTVTDSAGTSGGISSGLIIGLSCGLGAVLLVSIAVIVYIVLRRKKNKKEQQK